MSKSELDPIWLKRIAESLAGIQFGHVQIMIHDGKIVQIERTEKRRYEGNEPTGDFSQRSRNHRQI